MLEIETGHNKGQYWWSVKIVRRPEGRRPSSDLKVFHSDGLQTLILMLALLSISDTYLLYYLTIFTEKKPLYHVVFYGWIFRENNLLFLS